MQYNKSISNICLKINLEPSYYLFDEFVLDPDIQIGKEHGRHTFRVCFPISLRYESKLNFFFQPCMLGLLPLGME